MRTAGAPAERGGPDHQRLVTKLFQDRARRWDEVYRREDLLSVIVRLRHERALACVDGLGLAPGLHALEVGAGAGVMTAALADRGLLVQAVDRSPAMLELACSRAAAADASARVALTQADAGDLPYADGAFTLVVALGVIPWLPSAAAAAKELARVLRPGGFLVVCAENSAKLNILLDPRHHPWLQPARSAVKAGLIRVGAWRPPAGPRITAHRPAEFDRILARSGLRPLARSTLGFGPFTLLGLPVLPKRLGLRVNGWLQGLADRGVPGVRSAGSQYLVLASRTATLADLGELRAAARSETVTARPSPP
ncbi:MAG TPA: methyltransferase domain-containing protein [Streptosporangiaceae bacterium]|jgi:ubiquinone/menaquinone biosynthesis C-methylase UbiE|nr:methyltransferase domain-containing protein [Streptosporangiaceae bacterium]